MVEHTTADPKVPGSIPGLVLYRVMDYDEACFMYLTPEVVHNCPLCTKRSQIPTQKEQGATPGILVSRLNNRW